MARHTTGKLPLSRLSECRRRRVPLAEGGPAMGEDREDEGARPLCCENPGSALHSLEQCTPCVWCPG